MFFWDHKRQIGGQCLSGTKKKAGPRLGYSCIKPHGRGSQELEQRVARVEAASQWGHQSHLERDSRYKWLCIEAHLFSPLLCLVFKISPPQHVWKCIAHADLRYESGSYSATDNTLYPSVPFRTNWNSDKAPSWRQLRLGYLSILVPFPWTW